MKYIDCFNCYCGYHVPLNEKPTSRKALIAALNIYFYGASRNVKIPIKVDLKPDDWEERFAPEPTIHRKLNRQIQHAFQRQKNNQAKTS